MPNVKAIINKHNKSITNPQPHDQNQDDCNCQNKATCPLDQNCQAASLVYEATLESNDTEKKYIGLCETTFKKRFGTHKLSLNNENYKNSTTLSKAFWKIKEKNENPTVRWRIMCHKRAYTPETNNCSLCLQEKFEIATFPGRNLLNKRTEIIAKCRHRRKFLLETFE